MPRTPIPKYVKTVLFGLQARGYNAYLVGGCVRDIIMEQTPNDWDICTSALPEEVLDTFPGSEPTGLKHGTVTVKVGNHSAEVTTFRTEGDYRDHRRPDSVTFVSDLMSDLSRRDFTMNAIALSSDGLITDPYNGLGDIEKKTVRCVGNPSLRFEEDALRMLRALRFSARLGFTIEYETLSAIEQKAALCETLAPERVRDEIEKILLTQRPETAGIAVSMGLLSRYVGGSGWRNPDFSAIDCMPRKALFRWAAFAIMLRKYGFIPSVNGFLTELRLDGRTIRCCTDASEMLKNEPPQSRLEWKRLLSQYGVDSVNCAAATFEMLYGADCSKELRSIYKSGECFSVKHLAVNGDDLIDLGLRGQEIGEMLKFMLDYVMEYPENNRREILLSLVYSEE